MCGWNTKDEVEIDDPYGIATKVAYKDYQKPWAQSQEITTQCQVGPPPSLKCCSNANKIGRGACTGESTCNIDSTCTIDGKIIDNADRAAKGEDKECDPKCIGGACINGERCVCAVGRGGDACEKCTLTDAICSDVENSHADTALCVCRCDDGFDGDGVSGDWPEICLPKIQEKKSNTNIFIYGGCAIGIIVIMIIIGVVMTGPDKPTNGVVK